MVKGMGKTVRAIRSYRELEVYQMAVEGAIRVFELTKRFPPEERFALVDQIRRSSRSVCANIAEAWRKRRYEAAFVSKLSDAEAEAAETQVWAELAFRFGYLDKQTFTEIDDHYNRLIGKLVRMMDNPKSWLIVSPSERRRRNGEETEKRGNGEAEKRGKGKAGKRNERGSD